MYDSTKPYIPEVLRLIATTWETEHVSVGNDGSVREKPSWGFQYPRYPHTDGIGTKGFYHWKKRTLREAVEDVLAANLNDLLVARATAYEAIPTISLPEDDHEVVFEVTRYLAMECLARGIAIPCGETEILNTLDGMNVSLAVRGFIANRRQNRFQVGDMLIGVASAGLHTNGFTLVRDVFGEEFRPEFVEPSANYYDVYRFLCLANEGWEVHGMAHITGGGFMRLLKMISHDEDIRISHGSLLPQGIFYDLYSRGVSDEIMYKTFNCGIGFIFSVAASHAQHYLALFNDIAQLRTDVIGEVTTGSGRIMIRSSFAPGWIIFNK